MDILDSVSLFIEWTKSEQANPDNIMGGEGTSEQKVNGLETKKVYENRTLNDCL